MQRECDRFKVTFTIVLSIVVIILIQQFNALTLVLLCPDIYGVKDV